MVLNQVQGLKEKSHEVSARKNNNRLRYNKKCWGGRIPPPALLGLNLSEAQSEEQLSECIKQRKYTVSDQVNS